MNSKRIAHQPQALEKMSTCIEGFDEITGGGLPQNRTSLVIGGPGTGKTVFALQTLANGARRWNEPGIFVAFEENSHQIQENEFIRYENLPLKTKDGQLIQVEFVSNVYMVGDEKVIQYNIRDINKHNEAEKALRSARLRVMCDPLAILSHSQAHV